MADGTGLLNQHTSNRIVSSNLTASAKLPRGTSVVDRQAHNLEAGGSSPSPATIYLGNIMNSSPERNTFQKEQYTEQCKEQGEEPSQAYIDMWEQSKIDKQAKEANAEWCKNNLEYDLRSTKWICDKAKASEFYAQNLYAAMCNQDWQKNEVWPLLKSETYSCSWRYAGGIVADMVEQGDYIDWYCSGIRGASDLAVDHNATLPGDFVSEGHVTDEIRNDLFELGWIPVDQTDDKYI